MSNRKSNQSQPTTEQVIGLAKIAIHMKRLQKEANPGALARKFGTSKQLIEYHIAKIERGEE